MSKKSYWVINVDAFSLENEDFQTWYFNCPKCKHTIAFPVIRLWGIPRPNYCEHCGKRLFIRKRDEKWYTTMTTM